MALPSRAQDQKLVLCTKKQTAMGTALTDASLIAATTGARYSPDKDVSGQIDRKFWTDIGLAMKGHDYATTRFETERDYLGAYSFPADSWLAAWIAAFAMGSITSTQPNVGTNPTAWKHVIKPLDPSAGSKDMPLTTIYLEDAQTANLQRRLLDCTVKDFSWDFPPSAPAQLTANIMGSGRQTPGALATPPALASLNLLMSNDLVLKYGTQGAPTDISTQIVRGSVKFGFTWVPDDTNSRTLGGGFYRTRLWVGGPPQLTLSFQRFVDDAVSTPQDDWLAETIQEVLLHVDGTQIGPGPEKHYMEVRGLAVRPDVIKLGQSGDKTVYEYSFGPGHWIKQGSADVVTITCQNLSTGFLN
jgi:hypothetical protein